MAPASKPGEVWCADFKGWFYTTNGTRCDPLTVTDSFSRMILCCRALTPPISTDELKAIFRALFEQHGLPLVLKTDNGPPFASTGLGLTAFSTWLISLGISPRRIPPGKPQKNGRHERMHRVLKAETLQPRPAASLHGQQLRFDAFVKTYDQERPHEALDFAIPASRYEPSPRRYPPAVLPPEYPAGATVRRVQKDGYITWQQRTYFISSALAGQDIWLIEDDEEPFLEIVYYREYVGRLNIRRGLVQQAQAGKQPKELLSLPHSGQST